MIEKYLSIPTRSLFANVVVYLCCCYKTTKYYFMIFSLLTTDCWLLLLLGLALSPFFSSVGLEKFIERAYNVVILFCTFSPSFSHTHFRINPQRALDLEYGFCFDRGTYSQQSWKNVTWKNNWGHVEAKTYWKCFHAPIQIINNSNLTFFDKVFGVFYQKVEREGEKRKNGLIERYESEEQECSFNVGRML